MGVPQLEYTTDERNPISEEINFELHEENVKHQMANPELFIKSNFLKLYENDIAELDEELFDDVDRDEVRQMKLTLLNYIVDGLEELWGVTFDTDDIELEKLVVPFYKFFINRKEIVSTAVIRFIRKNKASIIQDLSLDAGSDDVSTASFKKIFKRNDAVILANINKVIEHIYETYFDNFEDFVKNVNKDMDKKYLEKCFKFADYVDPSDFIVVDLKREFMDESIASEIIVQVTHKLSNLFKPKDK